MVFYVYADFCSLLAATSQFSILIGQKMQLTGCHNDNEMRNATCVDAKISIEWPYCSFLYCDHALLCQQSTGFAVVTLLCKSEPIVTVFTPTDNVSFLSSPVFPGLYEFCSIYTGASLQGAVQLNHKVGFISHFKYS